MPRAVFSIDVQDARFKEFLALYEKYRADLPKMADFWVDAEKAIEGAADAVGKVGDATEGAAEAHDKLISKSGEAAKSAESMAAVVAAIAASTTLITEEKKAQSEADKAAAKAAKEQLDIERDALKVQREREKSAQDHQIKIREFYQDSIGLTGAVARNVVDITERIAKWAVLSLGAGLIGGGAGLYGLDRLGEDVASSRRVAQGLGIPVGELQAFNVNFGERLGLGADFLNTVQDVKFGLGTQWKFQGLGISPEEVARDNTTELTIAAIRRLHDLWSEAGPLGHNKEWMAGHGLEGVVTPNQWQAIGTQSTADLNSWIDRYRHDARTMGASDPVQKEWVDFVTQLHRAGEQIEKAFVEGLEPLVRSDAIPKLSAAVEHVLATFLRNKDIDKWVDEFAKGISIFADYLGSDKLEKSIKTFVDDMAYAAERMVNVLRFLHLIPQTPDENTLAPNQYGPPMPTNSDLMQDLPSIYANRQQTMLSLHGAMLQPGQDMDFAPLEQQTGLPSGLLRAIGMQESGLNPNVATTWDGTPPMAHEGIFQQSTVFEKDFGITSPPTPEEAAKGEAIALRKYKQLFHGNIAQVIAAQNEGPGGVERQIEEAKLKGGDWFTYAPANVQKYVNDVARRMNISVDVLNRENMTTGLNQNDDEWRKLASYNQSINPADNQSQYVSSSSRSAGSSGSGAPIRVDLHVSVLNQTGAQIAMVANAVRQ